MMDSGVSQYNSPSFSSTLLDAIYRSIDDGEDLNVFYREGNAMSMKQQGANVRRGGSAFNSEEEMANFQRACMIEKWMEKKATEKAAAGRRKSIAAVDLSTKKPRKSDRTVSSSWSSSDSSVGGFFSSSETEKFHLPKPKPVRTGFEKTVQYEPDLKPKHEGGGFLKTKSRALKIYGDLKKVKQPISPGGKLAGFLNSLFSAAGKPKNTGGGDESRSRSPSLKSTNDSTCSSASSFSRSCLSKTPSSRGKPSTTAAAKRSVRFSPVSVIVDDRKILDIHNKVDSKNDSIRNVINKELMVHVMEKNRRVEEVARDLLRNYHKKTQMECEFEFSVRNLNKPFVTDHFDVEDEEDDDDAASYASSDLFELDNLSAIGMERYREELPVYETTHLDHTNRAVANGLVF